MISFTSSGSFKKMESFLGRSSKVDILGIMNSCGQRGVIALSSATPVDSGKAKSSWSYKATRRGSVYSLAWYNSDTENGFPVVIMLQYGYGTGTGGFVEGRDYINPAIRPIFDDLSHKIWKAVTSS
jgi:hypothetical protein